MLRHAQQHPPGRALRAVPALHLALHAGNGRGARIRQAPDGQNTHGRRVRPAEDRLNRFSSLRDVTASRGPSGSNGMAMTFRCGKCELFKFVNGRKLAKVKGLRQFVCRECAQ